MKVFCILIICFSLFAQKVDFSVRILYLQTDRSDIASKLNTFASEIEKQLNNYKWDLPHTDFEKIETNISVNIEKLIAGYNFAGMITVSSGPASESRQFVPLRKNIYFNERDIAFNVNYENEPKMDIMDPTTVETIILFYANLVMGENFDRLSYTGSSNFILEGDFYYQKMYSFENLLTLSSERTEWKKRLEIINDFRMIKNIELRKANALIYNAVYFLNTGKGERAGFFVEHIYEALNKAGEISEMFFTNNFYALGEIFSLGENKHLEFLIEKDPERKDFYSRKMQGRSNTQSK